MFKSVIELIKEAVKLNIEKVDRGNVRGSLLTFGMIEGYRDVLRSMGHEVGIFINIEDNGCERIRYMEIDGIAIVRENEIDYDGYNELLEK